MHRKQHEVSRMRDGLCEVRKRHPCPATRDFSSLCRVQHSDHLTNGLPCLPLNTHNPVRAGSGSSMKYLPICMSSWLKRGILQSTDPLIAVGSPLVHPGYAMDRPPFLPQKSLTLLTPAATKKTAERLMEEVPELRGVIKRENFIPGIASPDIDSVPRVYELLAGCDVRADIFPLRTGPLVMYKQQSRIHIEFPRGGYPKIHAVEQHVGNPPVKHFVDACSGVGTLGLTAACLGVPHVVLNDAWYASAFWSAFNLEVNREYLRIDRVRIFEQEEDMQKHPVMKEPIKIAETEGEQTIEVYQGDFRRLHTVLSLDPPPVTGIRPVRKE